MHTVSKSIEFDAGHRVPLHGSKCRNPHGHRYKVVAHVRGELATTGSSTGMVVDFGHLKELLQTYVHDKYDHGFIVWQDDVPMLNGLAGYEEGRQWKVIVVPFHPTAENLAEDIFHQLAGRVARMMEGCSLSLIEVWETPTSCATFRG